MSGLKPWKHRRPTSNRGDMAMTMSSSLGRPLDCDKMTAVLDEIAFDGSPTFRENKLNLKKRTKVGKYLPKSLFPKTVNVDVEDPRAE